MSNWVLNTATVVLISCLLHSTVSKDSDGFIIYSNSFAVELSLDVPDILDLVDTYGFQLESKHDSLNVFHLIHPDVPHFSKEKAHHYLQNLEEDHRVKHVSQQERLIRHKRGLIIHDKQQELAQANVDNSIYQRVVPRLQAKSIDKHQTSVPQFNDPYFFDQWYLNNMGQTGGRPGLDLNVLPLWRENITGAGVVICILDDGIDHTHPDLVNNYDTEASLDLNGKSGDLDPMPDDTNPNNGHGTQCAGAVVAKANNSVCGVGLAYGAKIGGVRMLDGTITDLLESRALLFKPNYIDIYSASWGPVDNGSTMESPQKYAKLALKKGVEEGRNGLGVIYVWATGNGGLVHDDCNADGYVSSVETLAVGSVSDKGQKPYFMEECTSTIAVVPTGGEADMPTKGENSKKKIKVVTTGLHNSCIENFEGTSGAAPLAAGCIALVLQTNPRLTWRDVQHLVVHSTRIPSAEGKWFLNGAGIHVSHVFGFGMMDCSRMVELAQSWTNVPPQRKCIHHSKAMKRKVSFGEPIIINLLCNGCAGNSSAEINRLEHVQIYIKLNHSHRGDLQIFLISPAGTRSQVLSPRKLDKSNDGIDFYFLTVHCWGENPHGNWTLKILDTNDNGEDGILLNWSLILHGYLMNKQFKNSIVRNLSQKEISSIIKEEYHRVVSIVNLNKKSTLTKNSSDKKSVNKLSDKPLEDNLRIPLVPGLKEDFKERKYQSMNLKNFLKRSRYISEETDSLGKIPPVTLTLTETRIRDVADTSNETKRVPILPKPLTPYDLGKAITDDYSKPRVHSLTKNDNFPNWVGIKRTIQKEPIPSNPGNILMNSDASSEDDWNQVESLGGIREDSQLDESNPNDFENEANTDRRDISGIKDASLIPKTDSSRRITVKPKLVFHRTTTEKSMKSKTVDGINAESMFVSALNIRSKSGKSMENGSGSEKCNSGSSELDLLKSVVKKLLLSLDKQKGNKSIVLDGRNLKTLKNSETKACSNKAKGEIVINVDDLKELGDHSLSNTKRVANSVLPFENELEALQNNKRSKIPKSSRLFPRSVKTLKFNNQAPLGKTEENSNSIKKTKRYEQF